VQNFANEAHFATAACAFRAWAQGPPNPMLRGKSSFGLPPINKFLTFLLHCNKNVL
jgi:hypothetical protein